MESGILTLRSSVAACNPYRGVATLRYGCCHDNGRSTATECYSYATGATHAADRARIAPHPQYTSNDRHSAASRTGTGESIGSAMKLDTRRQLLQHVTVTNPVMQTGAWQGSDLSKVS